MGLLLRVGVLVSASIVVLGAIIYLWHHGSDVPDYRSFRGEPRSLRDLPAILQSVIALKGRGIIQLGLLLLIATPVLRVAFAVYAFARQHDRLYIVISLVVLSVLLFSLFLMR